MLRVSRRGAFVVVHERVRGAAKSARVNRFPAADVFDVTVHADEGNDRVDCRALRLRANLYGHEGNDTLLGGRADDTLAGHRFGHFTPPPSASIANRSRLVKLK